MDEMFLYITLGIVLGTISRISMLKEDYRRYPTSPNGVLIHTTVGFIAAALGAVAIPALVTKNFVAVTFLTLAIQQFRSIRKSERESLKDLESSEFIPRGTAYIDAISKSFEARNYVALLVSLITTSTSYLIDMGSIYSELFLGATAGVIAIYLFIKYTKQPKVGDVAHVEQAPISFKGYNMYVGDIFIMNVGIGATRKRLEKEAYGIIITPKNIDAEISLGNLGQRKAIQSDLARVFGTERFINTRRDFDTGRIAVMVVAIRRDKKLLLDVIKEVPLLESLRRNHALEGVKNNG